MDYTIPSESLKRGAIVRFWTGVREGEGRIGHLKYDGVYEIGNTPGVYIAAVEGKAIGFVALTHIEPIERGSQGGSHTK